MAPDDTRPGLTVVDGNAPDDDGEIVLLGADGEEADDGEIRILDGYKRRLAQIPLGPDHKGKWVKVWINCPWKTFKQLSNDDAAVVDKALTQFVDSHNLTYDDGTPLSTPLSLADVDAIDTLLRIKIVQQGAKAVQKAAGVDPTKQ